jgi:protein-S-isoprenylcysteine O-methyltransferase Ste14
MSDPSQGGMSPAETDARELPGVVAWPPLVYFVFLLGGLLLERFVWRLPFLPPGWRLPLAVLPILAGGIIGALGIGRFRAARTPVSPYEPPTALLTGGVYAYSRNPLYLGAARVYAGIACGANSLWALLLLVPALLVIRYGVIAREERYLARRFGEDYRRYAAQVRRWI